MYKPLPECLTIGDSGIHGLGIFATRDLYPGTDLGIAHIKLDGFPQGYCRTPLGGFYNHSDDPNCEKYSGDIGEWYIRTKRDVKVGEELTWTYTLYEIK